MGYQEFVESNKKDPLDGVEMYEDVLGWLLASPEQKASWINEAKEHKTTDYILEISKLADEYNDEVVTAIQERDMTDQEQKARDAILKGIKGMSKKEFGAKLKGADDAIDQTQWMHKKLQNVPLVGKASKEALSQAGSTEAGIKISRGMNMLGFKPETSMKAGLSTMKGMERGKEAIDSAGGTIKNFASEHGGKAAVVAGAGVAALGAAKLLSGRKKKKEIEG